MDKEFKKLTKQYAKDVLDLIKKHKRQEDSEEEEEEKSPAAPVATVAAAPPPAPPAAPAAPPTEDWTCAGQVWETPAKPCLGVGDKAKIRKGILFNGKRLSVCKDCSLARDRKNSQMKREQKRAKVQSAIQ